MLSIRRHISALSALTLLLLSGCARQPVLEPLAPPGHPVVQTRAWECGGNFSFVTREEGQVIWLFLPDRALQLLQDRNSSGKRFHSKDIDFIQQGNTASLKLPDTRYDDCRNNVQRAAREHARLNGADFRATGKAPDWALEITLDGDMQLVTGADKTIYHFVTPDPLVIESERKTLYSTRNRHHQIVVELTGTPCHDSNGETHEVSVNISLDDRRLKGCGGALH